MYAAYIAMMPQYDIRITINVAGRDIYETGGDLLNPMVQEVVPCFEELARERVRSKYAGEYTNDKDSLVFTFGQGPRIKSTEWTIQGKSVLRVWAAISGVNDPNVDTRIHPVGENER